MSSIGDLLGAALGQSLRDAAEEAAPDAASAEEPGPEESRAPEVEDESPAVSGDGSADESEGKRTADPADDGAEDRAAFVDPVLLVLAELSGQDPADIVPAQRLAEDLQIEGLALWAVAAEAERQAKAKFPDAAVKEWLTVADVQAAVAAAELEH